MPSFEKDTDCEDTEGGLESDLISLPIRKCPGVSTLTSSPEPEFGVSGQLFRHASI